jgi:hypothetical protein
MARLIIVEITAFDEHGEDTILRSLATDPNVVAVERIDQ